MQNTQSRNLQPTYYTACSCTFEIGFEIDSEDEISDSDFDGEMVNYSLMPDMFHWSLRMDS